MNVRLVVLAFAGLAALTASVFGQSYPAQDTQQPSGVAAPDQPVRPQVPVLTPRAPQQQGIEQPTQAPFVLTQEEQAQLDAILKQWEEHNRNIKTFDCMFKRWIYDVVFGPQDKPKFVDIGEIKYAAPDKGSFYAKVTVQADGKEVPIEDARAEHWISDGKSIFELNPRKKQLIEHKLPPQLQGKAIADSPLPFLFGSEAAKLKQRYWLRVVSAGQTNGQIFLEAFPKHQQDAANFSCAQFMIDAKDMNPFALKLIQPNKKDHITYQFYNVVVNNPLRLFQGDPFRPFTPFGWQKVVEEAPQTPGAQARRVPNDNPR
jgi:TIGR03009 family protein